MIKKLITFSVFFSLTTTVYSAQKFAIATSHQLATETAIEILKKGGNAIDASIAASFVLNVVQPYKMGIGGGGLLLAMDKNKSYYFDHRETAPASANEKMFLNVEGKPIERYPDAVTGPNPVGVPGTIAGLAAAHKKLGKLPWKTLLQPAIKIAKEGFPITKIFEDELQDNWDRLPQFAVTASIYGNGEGSFMKRGQILKQPVFASTLEKIANNGAVDFYTGALAKTWTASAQKEGVKITLDDLKKYKVNEPKTVHYKLFGFEAETAAPPSTGGILLASTIRFLESYYKKNEVPKFDSAKRIIVTAEALRYFQDLRDDLVADPPFGKLNPQDYLDSAQEKEAWKEIQKRIDEKLAKIETAVGKSNVFELTPKTLVASANNKTDRKQEWASGHTAHLSVVDQNGLSVAYTTTIEEIFGSGITVPGHGFLLNNELSDFDAQPGRPNSAAPGKRPRSNMSPTILYSKKGATREPVAVVGCAGGLRIPTSLAIILENYFIQKMSAREAVASVRFHPKKKDNLEVEQSLSAETIKKLKEAGYVVDVVPSMWAVAEILLRRSDKAPWEAASEFRYDGLAIAQ